MSVGWQSHDSHPDRVLSSFAVLLARSVSLLFLAPNATTDVCKLPRNEFKGYPRSASPCTLLVYLKVICGEMHLSISRRFSSDPARAASTARAAQRQESNEIFTIFNGFIIIAADT